MREDISSEVWQESEDSGMYRLHYYKIAMEREQFFAQYVDEELALAGCEDCLHFGKVWSCPKHDFTLEEFWSRYSAVELYAVKIVFDESLTTESYSEDEMQMLLGEIIPLETNRLYEYARKQEREHPESLCFSTGGACLKCKNGCTRIMDQPCRFPEEMRYSIEAIGVNACKATEELFEFPLLWSFYGQLPEYLTFVSGLLLK